MEPSSTITFELLDHLDLDAIADPFDKIEECQYFLNIASKEADAQHFRWLISAFLSAAYSFFDISVLNAFHAFADPKNGDLVEDAEALKILRQYVTIKPKGKLVTTGGYHEVTNQLYKLRKRNTHHYPLSIMDSGQGLPESFHFGNILNEGVPSLSFCRKTMALIRQVHQELQQ